MTSWKDAWETVALYAIALWAWLRCAAERYLGWRPASRNAVAICRVFVFRDDDPPTAKAADDPPTATADDGPPEADDPPTAVHTIDDRHFHELPARFFDPDTWEADALDATGWGAVRLEVRYRMQGRKFRMVLRPGDTCVFPPRPGKFANLCVLAASLRCKTGALDIDVTPRVLKYQGPKRDFHGTRITVRDMFPFDDHDDNATRFSHLKVVDSFARTTEIPYESEDHVLREG